MTVGVELIKKSTSCRLRVLAPLFVVGWFMPFVLLAFLFTWAAISLFGFKDEERVGIVKDLDAFSLFYCGSLMVFSTGLFAWIVIGSSVAL